MIRLISFLDILRSKASFQVKLFKLFDFVIGGFISFILPPSLNKNLSSQYKRILIIRPGGVGDAVFLLPILRELKEQQFIVDILCEQRNEEIFTSQVYLLNQVYVYENDLLKVFHESYDVIVDTEQWHYLSGIVSYFLKAQCKIGFATRPLRAKLYNKKIPYEINDYELHSFKRLFEELLDFKKTVSNINDCFDIPIEIKTWAAGQIPERSVSLFLGASISIKRFSFGQLLILIRDLLTQNYHPILLGGKDVIGLSKSLLYEIKDQRMIDFVGKTSLIQSAALIQRSNKFIGPDSGLMHLACAVGVPVVAVFGPTNISKWGPKGDKHRIISENVSCSPCTRFGYMLPTCRGSYHCMSELIIREK